MGHLHFAEGNIIYTRPTAIHKRTAVLVHNLAIQRSYALQQTLYLESLGEETCRLPLLLYSTFLPIGVRHRPENRSPSRSSFAKPYLTSLLPVHLSGLQCSRSHIATGNGNGHSFTVSTNSMTVPITVAKCESWRNLSRSNLSHRSPYLTPQSPYLSSAGTSAPCWERNAAFFAAVSCPSFCIPTFLQIHWTCCLVLFLQRIVLNCVYV